MDSFQSGRRHAGPPARRRNRAHCHFTAPPTSGMRADGRQDRGGHHDTVRCSHSRARVSVSSVDRPPSTKTARGQPRWPRPTRDEHGDHPSRRWPPTSLPPTTSAAYRHQQLLGLATDMSSPCRTASRGPGVDQRGQPRRRRFPDLPSHIRNCDRDQITPAHSQPRTPSRRPGAG